MLLLILHLLHLEETKPKEDAYGITAFYRSGYFKY